MREDHDLRRQLDFPWLIKSSSKEVQYTLYTGPEVVNKQKENQKS